MRDNKLELYLHLIWATWDRQPLVEASWEWQLYRSIVAEARKIGCVVLALGGMPDHVHLVVQYPAVLAVASLVKQVKGTSSRFVNDHIHPESRFRWQGSYAAFSVYHADLPRLIAYVRQQKEHHATTDLISGWELPSKTV